MGNRAEVLDRGAIERVNMIHLQLLLSHQERPCLACRDDIRVVCACHMGGLDRAAVGIIAFEMRGVDFNFSGMARCAEGNDDPIVSRSATAARFLAVAHVQAAAGCQDDPGIPVMGVAISDDPAGIDDGG